MVERLTEHNKTGWVLKLYDPQNKFEARQQLMSKFKLACEKLGKLEDIMEKYHCNDIEKLEQRLKLAHSVELLKDNGCDLSEYVIVTKSTLDNICPDFMKDAYFDSLIDKNLKLEQDRDTWKRACELACKVFCCKSYSEMELAIKNMTIIPEVTNYFYQFAKKGKGEQHDNR